MPSVTNYCRRGRILGRKQPDAVLGVARLPLPIQWRMATIQLLARLRRLTSLRPGAVGAAVVDVALRAVDAVAAQAGVDAAGEGRRGRQLQ